MQTLRQAREHPLVSPRPPQRDLSQMLLCVTTDTGLTLFTSKWSSHSALTRKNMEIMRKQRFLSIAHGDGADAGSRGARAGMPGDGRVVAGEGCAGLFVSIAESKDEILPAPQHLPCAWLTKCN